MRLPYGVQADEDDAQLALGFIDADEVVTFNIKGGTDGIWRNMGNGQVCARMKSVESISRSAFGACGAAERQL